MKKLNPVIISTFTAICGCGKQISASYEYIMLNEFLNHINRDHKEVLAKLEKRARAEARSQNGKGYLDLSDEDIGWPEAQETFREVWREEALKQMIKDKEI